MLNKSMEVQHPPCLATRLLNSFLRSDLAEEVRGDLEEKFYADLKNESAFKAKLNYWYQVLNYLRPFAIRKSKVHHLNNYDMFQSYFKIGWRNLLRNKGYSAINIGGLAIGIAVAMLIGLWVHDELTFDKSVANYDRLAQVMQHQTFNSVKGTERSIPRPLEFALRTAYSSDFKYLSMASWMGESILSVGEKSISKSGNYFQVDFPEMISLEMLKGTRQGLKEPNSILLSESTATALFGSAEPMNQAIRIGNRLDVKVTGIYKDIPANSSFNKLDFMSSWELYANSLEWIKTSTENWGNNSFQLYVLLSPNAEMKSVSEKIKKVKFNSSKNEQVSNPEIFLHPMTDWHLRSAWKEGEQVGGRIQSVWLFSIIGIFVLLLACINFMNLSTARSEKRAKEVGIRMSIGSMRTQLINQFLSESFLVVVLAFVAALVLVGLSLAWFNEIADKKIVIEWGNPQLWLISFMFIIFTSLLAGSYPALYLSSFHPVKVLKGTFKVGRFASLPRKVLVVVQFTVSLTLIIGTIIVYQQIQFTKSRPTGYNRDGLIMMRMNSTEFYGKLDMLRTELKNSGAVEEVAQSSGPLTAIWSNNGGFDWSGKDPALQAEFATVRVTPEFGKTVSWQIKEGRDFSRAFSTDSTAIIMNESAVKFMGIKNPIGMNIAWDETKLHVVGVIKDMVMESPYAPVKQTIYMIDYNNLNWINIKLNTNMATIESIAIIESIFKKNISTAPFEYKFVDAEFGDKFQAEERIGKLTSVFAVLAILISCLGLFGLASFVAEQRTKEIGIRKVLGASVIQLWRMLSKYFVILIIIYCALAIPLSFYYMSSWLLEYEYRTTITWNVFAIAAIGALLVTLLTVSYQAVKAALMDPVKSLKSE